MKWNEVLKMTIRQASASYYTSGSIPPIFAHLNFSFDSIFAHVIFDDDHFNETSDGTFKIFVYFYIISRKSFAHLQLANNGRCFSRKFTWFVTLYNDKWVPLKLIICRHFLCLPFLNFHFVIEFLLFTYKSCITKPYSIF